MTTQRTLAFRAYLPDGDVFEGDLAVEVDDEPVTPRAIVQYTGIDDKNGRRIYEGDIVDDQYQGSGQWVVIWNPHQAAWWLEPLTDADTDAPLVDVPGLEIVGNIHEQMPKAAALVSQFKDDVRRDLDLIEQSGAIGIVSEVPQ